MLNTFSCLLFSPLMTPFGVVALVDILSSLLLLFSSAFEVNKSMGVNQLAGPWMIRFYIDTGCMDSMSAYTLDGWVLLLSNVVKAERK